jgi:hypothetical protein
MSQLSKEQVRVYINEEHNRRSNLLQKYIRLCNEAKVQYCRSTFMQPAKCELIKSSTNQRINGWWSELFCLILVFSPIWQVTVDTMLLESDVTAKAILDLIPVLNITSLVIGTKRPPCSRYDIVYDASSFPQLNRVLEIYCA